MATLLEQIANIQSLYEDLEALAFGDENTSATHNGQTRDSLSKAIKGKFDALQAMVQGRLAYETKAAMDTAGAPPAGELAEVWNDPTLENNGLYGWDGSAWVSSSLYPVIKAISGDVSKKAISAKGAQLYSDHRIVRANLIDVDRITNGFFISYTATSEKLNTNSSYGVTDYIPLKEGDAVSFGGGVKTLNPFGIHSYDENLNYISTDESASGATAFTGVSGSAYIRVTVELSNLSTAYVTRDAKFQGEKPFSEKIPDDLIPAIPYIENLLRSVVTPGNLIDPSKCKAGYLGTTGFFSSGGSSYVVSDYIRCAGYDQISFNQYVNSATSVATVYYDSDMNMLSVDNSVSPQTIPVDAKYLRVTIDAESLSDAVLCFGSTFEGVDSVGLIDKNLFLRSLSEFRPDVDSVSSYFEVGKNLFDKDSVTSPAFIPYNGSGSFATYNNNYGVSDYIELTESQSLTISGSVNLRNPFGVYYYDENKTFVSVAEVLPSGATISGIAGCKYVRFSVELAKLGSVQAEYGVAATAYEAYKYQLNENNLPSSIVPGERRLGLPSRLFMTDDRSPSIYVDNICVAPLESYKKVQFSKGRNLRRQWDYPERAVGSDSISAYMTDERGITIDSKTITLETVDSAVVSGQTVNVMCVGDSFTDIAHYVDEIRDQLTGYGASVNLIGSRRAQYAPSESLSGGSMAGFLLSASSPARLLSVSGVTSIPDTAYPGVKYSDANGTEWLVIGSKIDSGSGLLNLAYTGGGEPPQEMPASGSLTLISGAGDSTITYSSWTESNRNPFYNPANSTVLDWSYYQTTWSTPDPDILVIQFTYNDVGSRRGDVPSTVAEALQIIDSFHAAYPAAGVVFSIEPPGAIHSTTSDTDLVALAFHDFTEALFTELSGAEYEGWCELAPSYAFVDLVNGYYSPEITPDDRYGIADKYPSDPVHPNETGMRQIADCIVPVIVKLLN